MFRILLLIASFTLAACGKTGDLYLPEDNAEADRTPTEQTGN